VTDEFREFGRWRAIVEDVFGKAACQTGLFDALWNHFADAGNWKVIETARSAAIAAEDFGLQVGVASNFDARLRTIMSAIDGLFGNVFVSSEIGHRKPSVLFFRAIEGWWECRPDQILLIGDDKENDIAGAQAAGWSAVLTDEKSDDLAAQLAVLRFEPMNDKDCFGE
jgi:putative hydrolase of the HAD superfamily